MPQRPPSHCADTACSPGCCHSSRLQAGVCWRARNHRGKFIYRVVEVGCIANKKFTQAHPHITLRNRMRGTSIKGTSRCSRYTSLTCLICEVLVYRVHQIISLDVEGRDGPLLPTEEWVEHELMKSSTGWVEVHKQSLVSEKICFIPRNVYGDG